jgi:uncharacterized protein (TIGR00304 family)
MGEKLQFNNYNKRMVPSSMRTPEDFLKLGVTIIFIGFITVFLGVILTILQNPAGSQVGGIILIGPIPIVFGSSPEITANMLWLGLIVAILYLFLWKMKH